MSTSLWLDSVSAANGDTSQPSASSIRNTTTDSGRTTSLRSCRLIAPKLKLGHWTSVDIGCARMAYRSGASA
eukprot:4486422-Prymnesium_polylepis.1